MISLASWMWLFDSGSGLLVRIAVGVTILAALAITDIRKNGRQAKRWREYRFLAAAALLALVYGVINDQIAAGISWEYFYHGKDLAQQLGSRAPPPESALRWEVLKLSLAAAWTAGLLVGVILLIANNPYRSLQPPLPLASLYKLLPLMLVAPAAASAVLGFMGYHGLIAPFAASMRGLPEDWQPARFQCVYGLILGAYVGGLAGALSGAMWILNRRRQ